MTRPSDIFYISDLFSPEQCNSLVKEVGDFDVNVKDDEVDRRYHSTRTDMLTPDSDIWYQARLAEAFILANEKFKFKLNGKLSVQALRYTGGDRFDWHYDVAVGTNPQRKLTAVTYLSSPAEYDGGATEWTNHPAKPQPQGHSVVFPSYLPHRATVITRGVRIVLVAWAYGPPFR